MQEPARHSPAYVVVATADATPLESLTSKQQLSSFGEFATFLETGYTLDHQIGDFELYVRRGDQPVQ